MKASVMFLGVVAATAALAVGAAAALPGETPFPSPTVADVFVSTRTVTAPTSALGNGVITSLFPRGNTVVFQVFAAATKSGKILTGSDVQYAYVKFPDGSTQKLTYGEPKKTTDPAWTASWTIPATYPLGLVDFKIRFKTTDKKYGNFVQIPVSTSQLTVTK